METILSMAHFQSSLGKHIETEFSESTVQFNKLSSYTSKNRYSSSIYCSGKRSTKNCIGFGNLLIYDIDNDNIGVLDFPLTDAKEYFSNIKSLIVTTKSHDKKKNGKVADRFRGILYIDKPINISVDDYPEYYIYVASILGIEKFIDHSCKDAARMYQPNPKQEVYYSQSKVVLSEKQLRISFEEKKFFDNSSREIVTESAIPDYSGSKVEYLRSILKTQPLLSLLKYDEKFVKGNRNNYLYSVGRYFLENHLFTTEVRDTLVWMNSLKNSLKDSELNSTIMRSLKI